MIEVASGMLSGIARAGWRRECVPSFFSFCERSAQMMGAHRPKRAPKRALAVLVLLFGLATGLGSATVVSGPARSFRLISFDLDDTFWPTGPVLRSANSAVAQAVG